MPLCDTAGQYHPSDQASPRRAKLNRSISRGVVWVVVLLSAVATLLASPLNQSAAPQAAWDPFQGAPPGAHYVGEAACATCHPAEAKTAPFTPMGQAAESVADCKILRRHPEVNGRVGAHSYRITRRGSESVYSVSDGRRTISAPIAWAFGQGEAGQTYILQYNGAYYQSRVSFFNDTQTLDRTLGVPEGPSGAAASLEEALGERMSTDETRDCFACHTTNSVSGFHLHLETMTLGVSCEACHGPGGDHVAAIKAGDTAKASIFNPGKLAPGDLDDFCGACHRTWWKVQMLHIQGVNNVRFQPYRLENSPCWSPDDARISCLACHNPHELVVRNNPGFYDAGCLKCHVTRTPAKPDPTHPGKPCPVGTKDCVTCHMPKYELPGGHFKFTDHDIRVVRPGAPYPD